MPIFDFKCPNKECELYNQPQEMVILSKDESVQCEQCSTTLVRIISVPSTKRIPHISWSKWRV